MNRVGQTTRFSFYRNLALTGLLLLTFSVQAVQTIIVDSDTSQLPLGSFLSYWEDPSNQKTFADVRTLDDGHWLPSGSDAPNFGYTQSAYWFALDIKNSGSGPNQFILEIAYPVLDRLDLYLIRGPDHTEHFASGDLLPFAQRPFAHRTFLFPVHLAEQETVTLYLQVVTSSALQVPITLWQETAFWLADQRFLAMLWLYYGIMLAMLLYNLFIWLAIRDRAYFFYVLFIASFVFFQLTLRGVSYQYLWPQQPWLNEKMLTLPLSAAIAFAVFFTIDLLRLKTESRQLYWVLAILGTVAGVNALSAPLITYLASVGISLVTSFCGCVLGITAGILMWRRGYSPARYYTIAWLSFLGGTLVFAFNKVGILPRTDLTEHAIQMGSALEAILLSFALASRINVMRHEKRLAERESEAARAAEQAKSQFLATMSHELRTPLNGVLGMLEVLLNSDLNDKQTHYVDTARQSGQHLLAIINDILDISKIEFDKMELARVEFDFVQLLDEVSGLFAEEAKRKGLVLRCDHSGSITHLLLGDPMRLRQVVMNLLNNALKFTEQGEVQVLSTVLRQAEDRILIEVSVSDTGIGIKPHYQATIFDAFSQADGSVTRKFGGTGLGLAISQRLVKLMGGTIRLDSRPGRGAKFWFRVWLTKSPKVVNKSQPAKTDPVVGTQPSESKQQLRVLLAEDNAINQEVTLAMMEQLGFSIDIAKNGLEAIEAFKKHRYDIVLMDCQMPQLDGFKATVAIRACESKQDCTAVPIIALTANVLEGDKERCLAVGMNDYLAKPFNLQQLKNKLETYLR